MRIIHIQPDAPLKPRVGAACNGCGVCCLAEPCPVGMLVSLKRHGACTALRWDDGERRYTCGLLSPVHRPAWLPAWWVRRVIAAGIGCDSDLEVERRAPPADGR